MDDYEDEGEWYVLVPEAELKEWQRRQELVKKTRAAITVSLTLAQLSHKDTHPKVGSLLSSACDYLERWFDNDDPIVVADSRRR